MVDALKFWIEEVGVDGFRCDVAGEVPTDFWDEARPKLQESNDDLLRLSREASKPELQVNGFDMGYNWPMKDLFNAIAATAGQNSYKKADGTAVEYPEKHAIDIDTLLALQSLQYPADTYLMNREEPSLTVTAILPTPWRCCRTRFPACRSSIPARRQA